MRKFVRVLLIAALTWTCTNCTPAIAAILEVSLKTNDIIYDPVSDTIYASVPSSAGLPNGNSIVPINPVTGSLGSPIFVGSEPNRLAVSDDGQYLYVGMDGTAKIARVNLVSKNVDLQFALNPGSTTPFFPDDIEVVPGQSGSIAVSRLDLSRSPNFAGVAIYDNGVARLTTISGFDGSHEIEFGASPSFLYGYDSDSTRFTFQKMAISASGVTTVNSFATVFTGFNLDFKIAGGIAYSTSGRAMNPDTGGLLGTFNTSGSIEPDTNNGRMYVLSSTNTIVPFNLTNFVQLNGGLPIPGVTGSTSSLIRFESDGLAFRSSDGQVFLIHDSNLVPVPEPATIWLMASAFTAFCAFRTNKPVRVTANSEVE